MLIVSDIANRVSRIELQRANFNGDVLGLR